MKIRHILLLLALLYGAADMRAQVNNTARDTNLIKLNGYINTIIDQTPPVADSLIAISDYLITMSRDSVMKSYVARILFEKFYTSPIMGMEGPAIHIAQKYFINGKLKAFNDKDLQDIKFYVEFNKNSLIGMQAPALSMVSSNGDSVSLGSVKSEYTLLYFYDDECSVCKKEAPKIRALLRSFDKTEISVYAVYVQSSKENWLADISKNYSADSLGKHKWYFVYDPEMISNYQYLYGVVSTPKLFLLDKSHKIIGRGLSSESLSDLLNSLIYGESEQKARLLMFFHNYFSKTDFGNKEQMSRSFSGLREMAGGDTTLFRAIFSELYLYLKYADTPAGKMAADQLADEYITGMPAMWPEQFVSKIRKSTGLSRKNTPGSIIDEIYLYNLKGKKILLGKSDKAKNLIVFFDSECPICVNEMKWLNEKAGEYRKRGIEPVAVYIGSRPEEAESFAKKENITLNIVYDKNGSAQLYTKFDLSSVPAIYILDNKRKIIDKDLTHNQLENLLR